MHRAKMVSSARFRKQEETSAYIEFCFCPNILEHSNLKQLKSMSEDSPELPEGDR